MRKMFGVDFFVQQTVVLEKLQGRERQWQMRRKKLLPEVPLFLGRDPWRWGKQLDLCFRP